MARILLIDDDDAVRTAISLTLAAAGHTVEEAGDGREGMKLFPLIDVELVITDIIMPEREGIEVLMALRRQRPEIKVIAISGGGRQNARDLLRVAMQLGAGQTLAKPFTPAELLAAVDELVAAAAGPVRLPGGR